MRGARLPLRRAEARSSIFDLPLLGSRPELRYNPGMTCRPFLLGVVGGTGSGKTTVARAIVEAVGATRIALIEQDSYYRDIE